jgi:hypothetical protein
MPFDIQPTATVHAFCESDAFVNILEGPRGEGKTTGGFYRQLHKAAQLPAHVLPLRTAVIRDTLVNLRRTTIQTLHELEGRALAVEWLNDAGHESGAVLARGRVKLDFFGLDRMAEINKLQGMGLGCLWLEEPAPAADISGGIPAEVFGVGATSLRQPGVDGWVQVTENPPDHDHWIVDVTRRLRELASLYPGVGLTVRVFHIPKGENPHLSDVQRLKNRLALEAIGRADLVGRLIEGRRDQVILGEAVMPEYSDESHVAPGPLPILRHLPIVRCWDFGLTPTCHWTQITPLGHWRLLWCVQGQNLGVEQLVETQLIPWEAEYLRGFEGGFRDVGDFAGTTREQSNSERSAALALEELLGTSFEPGPIEWPARRDALKGVLNRMIRGTPLVQVDPENRLARRALRAGWHYPKDGLGRITPTLEAAKRASGLHDHVGHALAHGASVLFPIGTYVSRHRPRPRVPVAPGRPAPRSWLAV